MAKSLAKTPKLPKAPRGKLKFSGVKAAAKSAKPKPEKPSWSSAHEAALEALIHAWTTGVIIDTETTSLQPSDAYIRNEAAMARPGDRLPLQRLRDRCVAEGEAIKPQGDCIVEVAAVSAFSGEVLFRSLVRPVEKFGPVARQKLSGAGFDFDGLLAAPEWPEVWQGLVAAVKDRGTCHVGWNAEFDKRMLIQMNQRFGISDDPGYPVEVRHLFLGFTRTGQGRSVADLKQLAAAYLRKKGVEDGGDEFEDVDDAPVKPVLGGSSSNYTVGDTETALQCGLANWVDAQPIVGLLAGKGRYYKLETAMQEAGLAYRGSAHNAAVDSIAVADLLAFYVKRYVSG